jgi:hypothetical protein
MPHSSYEAPANARAIAGPATDVPGARNAGCFGPTPCRRDVAPARNPPEDTIVATKRRTSGTKAPARRANEPISNRGVHGEGNYQASREYNEATRRFVKSGRVADAGRRAAPASSDEAAELEDAERAGRERARGEDPVDPVPATPARRPGGRAR